MVERRVCTFCGKEIEPGTGRMYVKKDGVIYQFCTSKCFKNLVELRRVPRRTTWTGWYAREKQVRMKGVEPEPKPKKARKVRKRAEPEEKKPNPEEAAESEAVEEEKADAVEDGDEGEER
jgi:large subunit ribosomal protein L24e